MQNSSSKIQPSKSILDKNSEERASREQEERFRAEEEQRRILPPKVPSKEPELPPKFEESPKNIDMMPTHKKLELPNSVENSIMKHIAGAKGADRNNPGKQGGGCCTIF